MTQILETLDRASAASTARTQCRLCPLRPRAVFKRITDEELAFIDERKVAEPQFEAGAALFHEGQSVERLFTLLRGWAFRFKSLPDGRRQILNVLLPGDLIGLQAKLFDEASHGVEALTEVTLCAFSRDRTWDVFSRFPALAFDLTWLGAREERMVDEELLSVGRRSAAERVARLLLHLWHRADGLGLVTDASLAFPLTQTHIADSLGLSLVHTNRTLQALRRRRLFKLGGGVLSDLDAGKMRALSRYDPPDDRRPLY